MIAEAIDNLVSAFSPSSALKRKQARYALQSVERGIEAGKQSRIHSSNPTNRSPDSLFLTHGRLTRSNSRDLVLNNAYAKGAIRAIVRNVVGTGIKPQARTDNPTFNAAMEELFAQQSPFCDVTGEISFFEKQALVLTEALTAGDSLEHFVEIEDDPNRPVPLALETIDVDRLADDEFSMRRLTKDLPNGEYVKLGIHYDRLGRKLGYFVKSHHPNDILGWNEKIEYRSSKEMLHTYRKERASQNRGLPILTPVVWWLKNLGYLVEAEVVYRNVAACQGVYIKTFDGGDSGGLIPSSGTDTSDANGNTNLFLEPGAVTRLLPGEEVGMIDF
ncbi:MAG TPA: phage portal protein, partial [Planctomycetaceae bacterium]|nr:phage portal protein [Planctomycetaceae bacterium]